MTRQPWPGGLQAFAKSHTKRSEEVQPNALQPMLVAAHRRPRSVAAVVRGLGSEGDAAGKRMHMVGRLGQTQRRQGARPLWATQPLPSLLGG